VPDGGDLPKRVSGGTGLPRRQTNGGGLLGVFLAKAASLDARPTAAAAT
jgi:hypothetical protein